VIEKELTKRAARRLAIIRHAEEVSGSVAKTCRYYGISRACFTSGSSAIESSATMVCGTVPSALTPAQTPPGRRWSARSPIFGSTTISGRSGSRCI